MAGENETTIGYPSGSTMYVRTRQKTTGKMWVTGAPGSWQTLDLNAWATQYLACSDLGDDTYLVTNPTGMAASDESTLTFWIRSGVSPVQADDSQVGSGSLGPNSAAVDVDEIVDAIIASGALLVNVAPISLSFATGLVTSTALTAYRFASSTYIIPCVDSTNAPYNLSGKTVKFSTFNPSAPDVEIFNVTGVVGGTDNNQVTVIIPQTATQAARTLFWRLWNTTDDVVIGSGSLEIKANPDRT